MYIRILIISRFQDFEHFQIICIFIDVFMLELSISIEVGNTLVTGEKMNKAEQFFNTVDFSIETDFKERLRKQLFENSERTIPEQSLSDDSGDVNNTDSINTDVTDTNAVNADVINANIYKRKDSARELSFDELELVNAAGNISMQGQTLINRSKSKPIQDKTDASPWSKPFCGNISDHDVNS